MTWQRNGDRLQTKWGSRIRIGSLRGTQNGAREAVGWWKQVWLVVGSDEARNFSKSDMTECDLVKCGLLLPAVSHRVKWSVKRLVTSLPGGPQNAAYHARWHKYAHTCFINYTATMPGAYRANSDLTPAKVIHTVWNDNFPELNMEVHQQQNSLEAITSIVSCFSLISNVSPLPQLVMFSQIGAVLWEWMHLMSSALFTKQNLWQRWNHYFVHTPWRALDLFMRTLMPPLVCLLLFSHVLADVLV